jgi:hypothetical protein
VDDARDDSWRESFAMWLYLTAKPCHVGSMWTGLPTHYTILWFVAARRRDKALY